MKKAYLSIAIAVFFLTYTSGIWGQTTQTKLNQAELWNQFNGTWDCEIAKDTIHTFYMEPYGIGWVGWTKITTKDKTLMEGKLLFGYDKELDKIIVARIVKGNDLLLTASWFDPNNRNMRVDFKYASNPEMSPRKFEIEFKTPDLYLEYIIRNNKLVETKTWARVKK